MKLFLGTLMICMVMGVLLRKYDLRWSIAAMFGLCFLVLIGYYTFNQI